MGRYIKAMFSLRRIIIVDKKTLLCVACVLSVFIVVDINTRLHTVQRSDYCTSKTEETKRNEKLLAFAVFIVFPPNSSISVGTAQSQKSLEAGHFVNRYFELSNCDAIGSLRFYLFRYTADEPAKELFTSYLNDSFKHCERNLPIVVDDFLIKDPTMDGRFIRGIILDAYLDNVDYYYIVLSDGITEKTKTEVDLSHWKDILLQRSPHGVGVVAAMNPKESGSVSRLFFSKMHVEVFGAAFPVRISKLESALTYVVQMYSSKYLAVNEDGKEIIMEAKTTPASKAITNKWTNQLTEDIDMLNRYQSAVVSSRGSWRSISSSRNVIAMSLYGANRRYTIGALRNAQLLPVIFPGWHLWFYCEKPHPDGSIRYGKTPEKILRKIIELGSEIRYVDTVETGLAPMLWRFLVAEDLDVDAFEVRDCDSRLTPRDATVIGEWLTTNASFHCIRDHPSHSHFSVSGGLWGGRPRLLHSIFNGTMRSMMRRHGAGYLADMNFLGGEVWPKVKNFSFCHDSFSCHTFPSSHPFPVKRIGLEHLGQVYDENSVGRQGDMNILASAGVNAKCVPSV